MLESTSRLRPARLYVALFVFALTARFLVGACASPELKARVGLNRGGDGYEKIARNLVAGEGFRFRPGYARTTLRMPIYPGFLAGVFAVFGEKKWIVQLFQAFLGATSCILVATLARRAFGNRAALVAGGAWAAYPGDIVACARYGAESLSILLILATVLLYDRLRRSPSIGRGLLVGLGLAVATQTKSSSCVLPGVFLFALCVGLALRHNRKRLLLIGASIILPVAVFSFPWMYRGYVLTGHWFYPSTLGGCGLLDGYYVTTHLHTGTDVGKLLYEARELQRQLAEQHGIAIDPKENYYWTYKTARGEYRMDLLQKEQFKLLVAADPLDFMKRTFVNVARFWYMGRTHRTSLISGAIHATYLAVALIGIIRHRHRLWQEPLIWILILVHFNVLNAVVDPMVRYAVTAVPFVCLFVGAAFVSPGSRPALGESSRDYGESFLMQTPG